MLIESSDSFGGGFTCATADCGRGQVACNGAGEPRLHPSQNSHRHQTGAQDTHHISLVDGLNLPISITPQGGSGEKCTTTSCGVNINADCPLIWLTGSDGSIIGCKSACLAFNEPQYCCKDQYNSSSTCELTSYSMFFKNKSPQAYSYASDDTSSTFSCSGSTNYLLLSAHNEFHFYVII
ncbi:hypothetical protein SLE2022_078110 [Rubroshorea leprosula]